MLTRNARYPTLYTTEQPVDNANRIATLIVALRGLDQQQMLVVAPRGADEVIHLATGDDQRRVLLLVVELEVVIIIGKV